MVVEAVDRILGIPLRRTPLKGPYILEETDLFCQGTEQSLPITTARPMDPDTLALIDHTTTTDPKTLVREAITRAKLEPKWPFPKIRKLFGISRRIEWQAYPRSQASRNPNH